MYIVWGEDNLEEFKGRYTALELDEFIVVETEQTIKAYCVLENKDVRLETFPDLEIWTKNHAAFREGYTKQKWGFCLEMLGHLKGKFGGDMDDYYDEMIERIHELMEQDLPENWRGLQDLAGGQII